MLKIFIELVGMCASVFVTGLVVLFTPISDDRDIEVEEKGKSD